MDANDGQPLLRTPLYETHVAAGGRMVPFAGWEMPVQYSGVLPEVKAVRQTAGMFDVSHMGRFRATGKDALEFLQSVAASDVSTLPESGGAAQYSLLCRESGGVIDDIIIYRVSGDDFIIVVNASNRDKDMEWLRHRSTGFDVVLKDESDATALIAVQGPVAVGVVDSLSDSDLATLPRFGFTETTLSGVPVMAARTGYTGEDGFELFCPAGEADALWNRLAAGGVVPCGLGARDTLRLEAALPLYGNEMDEGINPFEARLSWVVKLDKADDFAGKAALAEAKATPRRQVLVGIEMEGKAIPRGGYAVYPAVEGSVPAGVVTSGTFSPMRGKGVALVRVDAALGKKGTPLDVMIRETRHRAIVVALPFYKTV